jgi:hypothetical protein
MKRQVVWANSVWLVLQELPEREGTEIVERLDLLVFCPQMYPVRRKGRFRWHRFSVLAIGWFITKLWTRQFIFAVSGLPAFL